MKYLILTLVLLLSEGALSTIASGIEVNIYVSSKSGVSSIITNEALASYNDKYSSAANHKAFAQSLSGAWSWRSDRTSVDHAKRSALINCQRSNQENEDSYPCEIININGFWIDQSEK